MIYQIHVSFSYFSFPQSWSEWTYRKFMIIVIINKVRMFYIDLKLKIYEKEAALSTLLVSLSPVCLFFRWLSSLPVQKEKTWNYRNYQIDRLERLAWYYFYILLFFQSVLERVFRYKLNKITILWTLLLDKIDYHAVTTTLEEKYFSLFSAEIFVWTFPFMGWLVSWHG